MKKLNTNIVGRMPLWQADIDFLQQGWQEVITAIVHELGMEKRYFVITGCVPYKPSQKFLQMPAGWVWWNGRILPVRALPATDVTSYANPVVRLAGVTQNYLQDGARSFVKADLTTHQVANVWQDDYLTPTVVERGSSQNFGIRLGIGCWTLKDMLAHSKADAESEWIATSNGDLEYKMVGRMVVLRGIVDCEDDYSTPSTTGLPSPLSGNAILNLALKDGGGVRVGNTGSLFAYDPGGAEVTLSGMMYMAATPYTETDPNTIDDNPIE